MSEKYIGNLQSICSPLGPLTVDGNDFVAVAYFNNWSYYRWVLQNGINIVISFFRPSFYLKSNSLAIKTKAMKVLNHKAESVTENDQKTRIARTALVWTDIYLVPPFLPRTFDLVDSKLKLQKKIFSQCKNRKMPKAKAPVEKLYFDQLRKADKQVIEFYPIFLRHHTLLKSAKELFSDVSEKPSEQKIIRTRNVVEKLGQNFGELSRWCENRAKSWPDFVDSAELNKEYEEKKKSFLARYGPRAVFDLMVSVIAEILSGGNIAVSAALPIIAEFGFYGFGTIMNFKWQASMLKKQARTYRKFSKRAANFLKVYDMPLRRDFLR